MFIPGRSFQPSIGFAGKAGACPSEAPFKCSALGQASGLAHKHETRLERLARDKHEHPEITAVKGFVVQAPGC